MNHARANPLTRLQSPLGIAGACLEPAVRTGLAGAPAVSGVLQTACPHCLSLRLWRRRCRRAGTASQPGTGLASRAPEDRRRSLPEPPRFGLRCESPTTPGRRGSRFQCALAGLLVVIVGTVRAAALSEAEVSDLYSEGKRFFREANAMAESQPEAAREVFAKAALRFERIASEGGIRNGRLYYNLGNCYFRLDDLGRAIVNYRRAEQYIPNDPNLRQNLDYARSRRQDRIDVPERTRVLQTVLFFHYDLGQRTRAAGFAIASAALWLLLCVRLLWRSAAWSWLAGGSAVVSLLLLGSLLVEWHHLRTVRPGVVVAAEATARKGDGMSFEPAFTEPLHAGTEFRLMEDRGEWLEVALDDGRTCWLPAKDTERVR